MVIDFHTHILPPSFRPKRPLLRRIDATFRALFERENAVLATAEELVEAMDADGVDTSVALGFGWCDQAVATESNDYLLDAARRFPGRIVPFCSVHPDWGDAALAEVERCVAAGAMGIGELHPASQGFDLATAPSLAPLMALADKHRLPVLVHGSEPVGHIYAGKGDTTPNVLAQFIARFPSTTIVCAHWGGGLPFYGLMPEVKVSLANTYFDTAATPFLYSSDVFAVAARAVGADRVLFGSDYPLVRPRRVLEQAAAKLGKEEAEAVLHGNAEQLLRRTR